MYTSQLVIVMYVNVYVYVNAYVNVYVNISLYIYIYIYIYICGNSWCMCMNLSCGGPYLLILNIHNDTL